MEALYPVVCKFQKLSLEEGSKSLLKLLKKNDVNYIIVYPDWYEYLMKQLQLLVSLSRCTQQGSKRNTHLRRN
jgi:hypothetical protein